MEELAKRYDPKEVESFKYERWLRDKLFSVTRDRKGNFSIVLPPPNVTGKLHLGHAWDGTIQDILIRFHHSLGKNTLFLSGMDHAGIATQAVVEGKLRAQGINKYDLGRTKFLEKMWEWKETYAGNIRKQWAKLGFALNYDVERFTLDEGLSKAVKTVFVKLYKEGLIYRGERIINWDPDQRTALSNVEVIHKEEEGKLYFIHYPIIGSNQSLIVATTRPETMFADVCLVVNPTDKRYKGVIGKTALNPSNGKSIPIIADEYVDTSFGTGVMKCTPAHDPNDFVLAEKYHLEKPICLNKDGTVNDLGLEFKGLGRFDAREKLVEKIKKDGRLEKIETIVHAVGHSERSDAIVEPYLSKQWFVKMKPLAARVLKQQKSNKKVNFYPERFEKVLVQWMEKVEDWTISRQLWWGHQIPAYYHKKTGAEYVGEEPPKNIADYDQDPDVLDTWFSSALWPFSTMGWPNTNDPLFKQFFPVSVMVTGYDIIFFWVARMIFQSLHFIDSVPFKDVYIHGIIRDAQGRKMSKSLGNGVDPMDVIETYGADALRYYLATNSTPGQDTRYIEEKVASSANYLNKIWNSARFIFSVLPADFKAAPIPVKTLHPINAFILKRMNDVITAVKENLLHYEIGFAASAIYNFVYDDFCSWYLEFSKVSLNSDDELQKSQTRQVLYLGLKNILIMMHPFAPFITEEIYQKLPDHLASIFLEPYPEPLRGVQSDGSTEFLMEIIQDARNFKVEQQLVPNAELTLLVETSIPLFFEKFQSYLDRFTFSKVERFLPAKAKATQTIAIHPLGKVYIESKEDVATLLLQMQKAIAEEQKEIARAQGMLSNPSFTGKAPAQKVQEEKDKLSFHQTKLKELNAKLEKMRGRK